MLSTTINHLSSNTRFEMELFYWNEGDKYVLRFTSKSLFNPKIEEHVCDTFEEAFRRYCANCIVYDVPVPQPMNEFEFRGIPESVVLPPKGGRR